MSEDDVGVAENLRVSQKASTEKHSLHEKVTAMAIVTSIPTVGVLCIDIAQILTNLYGNKWYSYIAASYVKFLEAAGAHIIPIWIGRERAYYAQIMRQINGILLPGGSVFVDEQLSAAQPNLSNDCVQSTRYIFTLANEMNARGEYFPLWGTCLGFQLLFINAADTPDVRIECQSMKCGVPLELSADFRDSHLFGNIPATLLQAMLEQPFAYHNHHFCITPQKLAAHALSSDWRVLATRTDGTDCRFITLVEHKSYPYFGCQFHPERIAYEQLIQMADNCPHTAECIELAQYFAKVFIDACRRNGNHFETRFEHQRHLLANFMPTFTGKHEKVRWLQCYLFERTDDYPVN